MQVAASLMERRLLDDAIFAHQTVDGCASLAANQQLSA